MNPPPKKDLEVLKVVAASSTRPSEGLQALSRLSTPFIMLKRQAAAPKTARKKKKGNATILTTSIDDRNVAAENVRAWDVSLSKNTGRVNASRRTLKHLHQAPTEIPSTGEGSGADGMATDTDTGNLADSESPRRVVDRERPKRKRTRALKENDSVRESLISPIPWSYSHFQTRIENWLPYCSAFMDESLRKDGLGNDAQSGLRPCQDCSASPAQFKCRDCTGGIMRCSACIVSFHENLPLHRVQVR